MKKMLIIASCLYISCFSPTTSDDKALCNSLWIENRENILSFIRKNERVPVGYYLNRTKSNRYLVCLEYDSINIEKIIYNKWININSSKNANEFIKCNIFSLYIYPGISWFRIYNMPDNIVMYYVPSNSVDSILEYRKDIFIQKHLWINDSIFITYFDGK